MKKANHSPSTQAVHAGSTGDSLYGGIVNPIYPASAYDYTDLVRYPRYFNTPNHQAIAMKMASLEKGEDALVLSSGMAAIMTTLFSLLKKGDHIIFQADLYGGTHNMALTTLKRFGIDHTMVDGSHLDNFAQAINKQTKAIYIETPSNPLLKITNIKEVAKLAQQHNIRTIIDNTFATPLNQNPIDLGIDVVLHSGTKYISGHSDLVCGVAVGSKRIIKGIRQTASIFGGSLDAQACYLVERSLKTIALRVARQNKSALDIARFLEKHSRVERVYYPGLPSHTGHNIAKRQMKGGYGGMLSFEVMGGPARFLKKLKMIKKAISLGGVETTISSPSQTSHVKVSAELRDKMGIKDNLLRLSVGIEDVKDIISDIDQALP